MRISPEVSLSILLTVNSGGSVYVDERILITVLWLYLPDGCISKSLITKLYSPELIPACQQSTGLLNGI